MFDVLKPGKGYAITFANGVRVEVDFGPMSRSEKINASQKECDVQPASRDAEIRVFTPGSRSAAEVHYNATAEQLADILHLCAHPTNVER